MRSIGNSHTLWVFPVVHMNKFLPSRDNGNMYKKMRALRASRYLLMALVVLAICETVVSSDVQTVVKNRIGKSIKLHCRSKDDDLGLHAVQNRGEYRWGFGINFLGTTLFYCDVSWKNLRGYYHFVAYSYKRDWGRCESECVLFITKVGIYGKNKETKHWELMYSFDKK